MNEIKKNFKYKVDWIIKSKYKEKYSIMGHLLNLSLSSGVTSRPKGVLACIKSLYYSWRHWK